MSRPRVMCLAKRLEVLAWYRKRDEVRATFKAEVAAAHRKKRAHGTVKNLAFTLGASERQIRECIRKAREWEQASRDQERRERRKAQPTQDQPHA